MGEIVEVVEMIVADMLILRERGWSVPSIARILARWTREEDERLFQLRAVEGKSFRDCAGILGRTRGACIGRWNRVVQHFPVDDETHQNEAPPSVAQPVPIFSIAPADFDGQCEHMDEKRCRLTAQPGRRICGTHITEKYNARIAARIT